MKKIVVCLLAGCLLLASLLPIAAQEPPPPTPLDPAVVVAEGAIAAAVGVDTPGAAVVVCRAGSTVMLEGVGYADLGSNLTVTPDTVFEIGALSAIFTAISVQRAAEQGRLLLDADIATYLPADFYEKLHLAYPVTLRQLLGSRAGLGGRVLDTAFRNPLYCFADLREALLGDVPEQVMLPDTAYSYSAYGITLAAYVLECAVGIPYCDYAKAEVLTPLGMEKTLLFDNGSATPDGMAVGYTAQDAGLFTEGQRLGRTYAGLYPATGALSTAKELSYLLLWLLNGSDTRVLTPAGKAELLAAAPNGVFVPSATVFSATGSLRSAVGSTANFSAALSLDPTTGVGALVLTNAPVSTLLTLPAGLLGGGIAGYTAMPEGDLLDPKLLRGTYGAAAAEHRTLVGRLLAIDKSFSVKANDDGTITIGEVTYTQVARGVFAELNGSPAPLLQFVLNAEGQVTALLQSDGIAAVKLPFYYNQAIYRILLYLMLLLAGWFILLGVMGFFVWRSRREGFHHLLPKLAAAILSILVFVQYAVAQRMGAAALTSFFTAMSVIALLLSILALVAFVLSVAASITDFKHLKSNVTIAALFVVFFLLCCFWHVTVL